MSLKGYKAHKTLHQDGGSDELLVTGLSGLLADDQHVLDAEAVAAAKTVKLDDFTTPDDNTDLNASATAHGLLPKLSNVVTQFLNGLGAFSVPAGGGPPIVRKTADETVNNSSTLQNDNHLLLAVGANEVWYIEVNLLVASSTAADIKLGWGYPTGCDVKWALGDFYTTTAALNEETESDSAGTAGTGKVCGIVVCALISNGASAGNVNLQWAQNTAEATDTKVLLNSFMETLELS